MSLGKQIAWDDTVLPFQLDNADIRGRFARLSRSIDTILTQHDYPPAVEALVAEATLLTALIGQTVKLRWKLSLQVRGKGAVRLIATDYQAPKEPGDPALLRAYAGFDRSQIDPDAPPFDQLGDGYFAITIDQGPGTRPYQGITPLDGMSLADCAETYFAQSEQLPTRFALACGKFQVPGQPDQWRAGGVMLQHMPKGSPHAEKAPRGLSGLMGAGDILHGDDAENWNRANILLDTVEPLELIGPELQPTDVLVRLFHEESPRVYDPQPVAFGCGCSAERARNSLSGFSAEEIATLVTDEGIVTADCQFCGAHYEFSPDELGSG